MEVQNTEINSRPDQGVDTANHTGTERVADDKLNYLHPKIAGIGTREGYAACLTPWCCFAQCYIQVDRKKPPPPGGFPMYYVPSSRTVCKRTSLEGFVPGSSRGYSYTRFLMREQSK